MKHLYIFILCIMLGLLSIQLCAFAQSSESPMKYIALDADMSGNTKDAGIALKRGIELALKEINENQYNGIPRLGLKIFDHRANPARGIKNIEDISKDKDILAIIGGVHTPVALEQLPNIHKFGIPYLGAWAAGTMVVDNGYNPNYVFRLSIRDAYAAPFFIQEAKERGYKKIALFLEKTGWGRSNYTALIEKAQDADIDIVSTQWFFWGDQESDFALHMKKIKPDEADAIILVANATEGAAFIKTLAALPLKERLPVISHWGITASDFPRFVGDAIHAVDLSFVQTWSFDHENTAPFKKKYCQSFGPCQSTRDMPSPVGTAHSYDLTHILFKALKNAKSLEHHDIRNALYTVDHYDGLIKTYEFPFSQTDHEALDGSDFGLYRYNKVGEIIKAN